MKEYELDLTPAIYQVKGEKLWRNPCEICNKKFEEGEKVVEIAKGSYDGRMSYKRFCYKCFMKTLLMNFYEGLTDKKLRRVVDYSCKQIESILLYNEFENDHFIRTKNLAKIFDKKKCLEK